MIKISRKTGLPEIVQAKLQEIASTYKLSLILLMGSYGTNFFRAPVSDIDVAYLAEHPLTTDEYLQLLADFAVLFEYPKIDLIDLIKAPGLLKFEAVTKGTLLLEKEQGFFNEYYLYCIRYYYDTKKFREITEQVFKTRLEEMLHGAK